MPGLLENRVIVVIGGTTGIGISAARAFLAEGARLVVMGRDKAHLEEALANLGPDVRGIPGGASVSGSAETAIQKGIDEFGGFHGLYHVAGGSGRRMGDGPLHEISDAGWRGTMDLNLSSLVFSNRAAVRQFLAQGIGGSILNLGSVLGWSPSPHHFGTH